MIEYEKAYKLGKKDYQHRLLHHTQPTLQVLDDILPPRGSYSETSLGLVDIPIEQIVGTKTNSRSNAFSGNFMPILNPDTEFAYKWERLSTSHQEEGIREPIQAYEYLNKFYVSEGNKRVSVLKYFGAAFIQGNVIRLIPKRTNELENKIYYEFLDFYRDTRINCIWFTKEGSFRKLLELIGRNPGEIWTPEESRDFRSIYYRFKSEYLREIDLPSITPGDAFLAFLKVYDYQEISNMPVRQLHQLIDKSYEEYKLLKSEKDIDLKLHPSTEKKPLLSRFLPTGTPKLKAAFIYEKTASSSAWTYAHELGRLHLEQTFPDEISTICYENITKETAEETIEDAIQNDCNLIFTTTPAFVQASVKCAIRHPNVRINNCSVNTSHRYIRTYYARTYEAKFLMGAIAGAMADNDRISYIADYPLYGTIADINAFALGAKMINPRAKIYLEWFCVRNVNIMDNLKKVNPSCISGKDMVIPEEASRLFGIYYVQDDVTHKLATPLVHWGRFYEQLIRTILNGTWKYDDDVSDLKAINYWWGISADVIDVICSRSLPLGTKRLVDFLKSSICRGDFNPFYGILYSQDGIIQDDPEKELSPEKIVSMNWLAENIIGHIPTKEELLDEALPVFYQQGIYTKG